VTPSILIRPELSKLINDYYRQLEKGIHPFEASVMFHYRFELIHPFTDGNGRVGREIFNYMLKKSGYPRLLFLGEDRDTYIRSLKAGNEEKYAEMIEVFADLINKQRHNILVENLKKVVKPPKKINQLRLDDFYI
jgi:Fic family protein